MLGKLFNDVVDIVTSPVKLGAKVMDIVADDTLVCDVVEELKDAVKVNK